MFKAARWRSEKNKIKAVFRLEFHATKVTKLGWESAMVSLVPADVGKPTTRSEKVTVMDGNCQWRKPIYETVKFNQDPKTGKIHDKFYNFVVSATGSAKATLIGEITINLSEYAEVLKPSTVSLPLKSSDSGPILHVTIQRLKADLRRRDAEENGDENVRDQERMDQLNNSDEEKDSKALETNLNLIEDDSFTMYKSQMKFPSSKPMHVYAGSNRNLRKSSGVDTAATMSTEKSSEQLTPKQNGMNNYDNHKDYVSFQLSTPQKGAFKSFNLVADHKDHQSSFSVASGPEGSTDGSTNSLVETGLGERTQDSEIESQTLETQLTKAKKNGQVHAMELSRIKEEREAFRIECQVKRLNDRTLSHLSHFDGKDPWSMLEEIKQELTHEKNLNANLRLQLEKTQESNSELLLAVEDLEKVLEQKNSDDLLGLKFRNPGQHIYDCKQELLETASEEDSEQCALEELVKGRREVKVAYSLGQQIINLQSEIELYKKDREDLEMQMEQLALDYEILKQENHGITSKLEQSRLREQLRMQYECSAHSTIISDLEACIRNLKNELDEQAEAFEADLRTLTRAKVQQEQRALQAEEALRKTRWNNANTAEHLQEEFERLSAQMSSTFQMNEKLAMQALVEASELRLQKCHLEESLEETRRELESVQNQCRAKVQELSNLITSQRKETDKLLVDLKEKSEELQNLKNYEQAREKSFSEEILILKSEVEKLSTENAVITEELEEKRKLIAEMEMLKASAKESEMLLQDRNFERETLKEDLKSMTAAAEKTVEELYDLRNLKENKEAEIKALNSELATLRAQHNDLKNSLSEDEVEKEILRKQVFHLRGDLRRKEDAITSIERKLKDSNARLASHSETTKAITKNKSSIHSPAPQISKEVANLREKIKVLEGKLKVKDVTAADTQNSFLLKEKDLLQKIEDLQKNISKHRAGLCGGTAQKNNNFNRENGDVPDGRNTSIKVNHLYGSQSQEAKVVDEKLHGVNVDDKSLPQPRATKDEQSGSNKELTISTAGTGSEDVNLKSSNLNQDSAADMSNKMAVIKEKNEAMEAELKEMQERYSEISLKFAQVEGERQQLVMTIRALKKN